MAGKKIPIDIDIGVKGQKDVENLNKALSKTEDALDDVESAGAGFAKKMIADADKLEAKFNDAKRSAELLGNAIGPELAAKIGQNKLETIALDMQKVGLSSDMVEADIDQLAASIKHLDEIGDRMGGPQKGLKDIGDAADKAQGSSAAASTAIGGIGNSITELPGAGALGPVAESFGMLAENALEGDANVRQLGTALGVMGGTAVVMWGVSKAMASIAESKAFHAEQAQSFADAIEEVGEGVGAVNKVLSETRGIVGRSGGIFGSGVLEGTKDVTEQLINAGVSFDEFASAVADGGPALDLVTGKLRDKKKALEDEQLALQKSGDFSKELNNEIQALGDAIEITAETHEDYASTLDKETAYSNWATESANKLAGGLKKVTGEADDATVESDGLARSLEDVEVQFTDLVSALDASDALRNAQGTFRDLKTAADEAFYAAASGADDAMVKQSEYLQAIDDTKRMVLGLSEEIGNIPESVTTSIITMIDEGKMAEAERRILALTAARQVYINAIARGGGGLQSGNSHTGSRFAAGETKFVVPGQVFTPDSPGRLASVEESQRMMRPASDGGGGVTLVFSPTIYGTPSDEMMRKMAGDIQRILRESQ
jgi:hypothetical protein